MAFKSLFSVGRPASRKALLSLDHIPNRSRGLPVCVRSQASTTAMLGSNDGVKPLVVVGSINADLVIEVPRLPKPGETLAGGTMNVYPGGKVRLHL